MIRTIAGHEILSLRRRGIFVAFLGLFLTMTAVAGMLGWSSHTTIIRVYEQAVKLLASRGEGAPPNPFLLKPELSLFSNMVVYIPLLGALLAIVLGHLSLADEETEGIGRLIFSRQVSRTDYLAGKLWSASLVIGATLTVGFAVSTLYLLLINHMFPSVGNLVRLALFYGLSWLYLMTFTLVGMVAMLMARRRSLALLSAMGVWLVITFVIPQFTSGLRPVASLNPITNPVSTSQRFFQITSIARPFSITERYKDLSGQILATAKAEPVLHTLAQLLPIAGLLIVLIITAATLVQRHDFSRSNSGE